MDDHNIDKYLTDIDTAVRPAAGGRFRQALSGRLDVGMYACRNPDKFASRVLDATPIDTDARNGPIKRIAHEVPLLADEDMVAAADGRMLGQYILAG